jgi:hypothetical protein
MFRLEGVGGTKSSISSLASTDRGRLLVPPFLPKSADEEFIGKPTIEASQRYGRPRQATELEQAIENVAGEVLVELTYKPFELNPNMPPEGEKAIEHLMRKYGRTAEDVAAGTRSATWARSATLPRRWFTWTAPSLSPVKSCTWMVGRARVTKTGFSTPRKNEALVAIRGLCCMSSRKETGLIAEIRNPSEW